MRFRILSSVPDNSINVGFTKSFAHDVDSSVGLLDMSREEDGNVIVLRDRLVSGSGGEIPTSDILVSTVSVVRRDQTNPRSLYYQYSVGRGRYLVRLPGVDSADVENATKQLDSAIRFVDAQGNLVVVNWTPGTPVWSGNGWTVDVYLDRKNTPEQIMWVQFDAYDTTTSSVVRNHKEVVNAEPLSTSVSVSLVNDAADSTNLKYEISADPTVDSAPAIALFPDPGSPASVSVSGTTLTVTGAAVNNITIGSGVPIRNVVDEINRLDEDITAVALNDSHQSALTDDTYTVAGNPQGVVIRFDNLVQVRFNDSVRIRAEKPWSASGEKPWYPRIRKGVVRQSYAAEWTNGQVPTRGDGHALFTVPEYDKQAYSKTYGSPYRDIIAESPIVLSPTVIRTRRAPIKSTSDVSVYLNDRLNNSLVDDIDLETGTIFLTERFENVSDISVNYTYEEKYYEYKGLNLNSLPPHNPDMVGKYVAVFLLPTKIKISDTTYSETVEDFTRSVYHVYGDSYTQVLSYVNDIQYTADVAFPPNRVKAPSLLLGIFRTIQNRSIDDTLELVDSRSPGGGIKPDTDVDYKDAPEARMMFDEGYWDGEPFQSTSVLIGDMPDISRDSLTGYPAVFDAITGQDWADPTGRLTNEEIDEALHRHVAAGTLVLPEVDLDYSVVNV